MEKDACTDVELIYYLDTYTEYFFCATGILECVLLLWYIYMRRHRLNLFCILKNEQPSSLPFGFVICRKSIFSCTWRKCESGSALGVLSGVDIPEKYIAVFSATLKNVNKFHKLLQDLCTQVLSLPFQEKETAIIGVQTWTPVNKRSSSKS